MGIYSHSIDTDMAIGSILSNFDSAFILHTVEDSLQMKFRPFGDAMPNFIDILNRQFDSVVDAGPDYRQQIEATRSESFKEIVDLICSYYNLQMAQPLDELNPMEAYGIARTMYDIFISNFTDYMINFYMTYIIQNMDGIYNYLLKDDNIRKPREKDKPVKSYIDDKFHLIHANLNKIIMNMTTYDIPFQVLITYFTDPNTAARISELFIDTGDIYKNHYAVYLLDQRYMADLLTCIKLRLQRRTQESLSVNNTIPQ